MSLDEGHPDTPASSGDSSPLNSARPFDPPAAISARRRPRRTPADRLRSALLALADGKGRIDHHGVKSWASITFAGTRNTVRIVFAGAEAVAAGETFIAELPEHEFAIPGQLVADAAVTGAEHTMLPEQRLLVECEILMLNDG